MWYGGDLSLNNKTQQNQENEEGRDKAVVRPDLEIRYFFFFLGISFWCTHDETFLGSNH